MSTNQHERLDDDVREALKSVRRTQFAAGFEERALQRWHSEREAETRPVNVQSYIARRAMKLVPIAIAASLLVAVYSSRASSKASNSTNRAGNALERVLGWPSITLDAMYGLGELNVTATDRLP